MNVYEIITDRIMKLLEAGTVPWHRPWQAGGEPKNLCSGKPYRGVNVLILSSAGYQSPYWLSFKQAQQRGGRVKKGEHGSPCVFWLWKEEEDRQGKKKKRAVLRYYTIFNVQQCEGIEVPKLEQVINEFSPIEKCETIVEQMPNRPPIEHKGNEAIYNCLSDIVTLPDKKTFDSEDHYYSTMFHELTHSTGHKSRLGRYNLTDRITDPTAYPREELVAEMGATFLCSHANIERHIMDNSASYIAGWLKRLENDKRMIVIASSQAQKSTDYILKKFAEDKEPDGDKEIDDSVP